MSDSASHLSIREITIADAEVVAALSGELGYQTSTSTMEARIRERLSMKDCGIFAAVLSGVVVGWVDVGVVQHLQVGSYAEIGGLVVASTARGAGIGEQLVRWAEQWARDRGLKTVVVRSQIARERAHQFYLRQGYERTKTSAVFTRLLSR